MALDDNLGILELIDSKQSEEDYKKLHWEGNFTDYLTLVKEDPKITRNAFQRVYDMIIQEGTTEYTDIKKKITRYNFFDDPHGDGKDAVFGIDVPLMRVMNALKSAAMGYGVQKRVILLHGPVGSAKSTIARLIKSGLERYSRTDEGALYTLEWDSDFDGRAEITPCPMNEEPLKLIPENLRSEVFKQFNNDGFHVHVEGHLCPVCRFMYEGLNAKYSGKSSEILDRVTVKRFLLSEENRKGIGTFQPKDEKNQDSTELTGDINYRKIAIYGSDSDPRAFNFDGEFQVANRGMIEFIEVLKLDVAFLYDLLGASQEHLIKPKKFSQTHIDELVMGHTNEAEFRKLQNNEFMEALKDRTVKIDIPYITKASEEIRIYNKDYHTGTVKKHIAPHAIELAATWAVLTRLEQPKKGELMQKLKLYDGKSIAGYTEEHVKELRKAAKREGLDGISPRYVQDKISNALVTSEAGACLSPFLILNELESGLKRHAQINDGDLKKHYSNLINVVKAEYETIVKKEVQMAISADPESLANLCSNYIDHVKAFTQKETVKNQYTGQYEEPDERLMRSIEEKIDIPESRKTSFRREIMNFIGALAVDGKKFDFRTNDRLLEALELKLFEDKKDTIKLSTLVSSVVDKETQEKIDVVKTRMIEQNGYCDTCASDVLNYVSSIFARGEAAEE